MWFRRETGCGERGRWSDFGVRVGVDVGVGVGVEERNWCGGRSGL